MMDIQDLRAVVRVCDAFLELVAKDQNYNSSYPVLCALDARAKALQSIREAIQNEQQA